MDEPLKGFRDLYPAEMAAHRAVIDAVEGTARRYGFREIATPTLEPTELYVEKSGEEITEDLYHFEDKGGRDVALAPELTPTVARMVAHRGKALPKPIKWFSTRPFWRYEQVQQGRFREFYQTNIDVFGSAEPEVDAEVIAVGADMLTGLGLSAEDFEFRVSHRDILGGVLESMDASVDTAEAIRAVDKRAKVDRAEYLALLVDAGLPYDGAERFDDLLVSASGDLDELVDFAESERVEAAVANLRAVLDATEDVGVREYCDVSLTTARGLDYYTGVVFECFDSTGEVSRSVFGGGRYDDLIESLGGPDVPAVGFAPGVMNSTLPLLLQRAGVWPAEELSTDYYVLQVGETRPIAARIARDLRERGHVVETDLSDRGFGSQLEYADSINAETTVIVGERDLENDEITIKDMASGDQVQVPVDDFPGDHDRPTYDDVA
jgi:histidyl-tRNA synthetase